MSPGGVPAVPGPTAAVPNPAALQLHSKPAKLTGNPVDANPGGRSVPGTRAAIPRGQQAPSSEASPSPFPASGILLKASSGLGTRVALWDPPSRAGLGQRQQILRRVPKISAAAAGWVGAMLIQTAWLHPKTSQLPDRWRFPGCAQVMRWEWDPEPQEEPDSHPALEHPSPSQVTSTLPPPQPRGSDQSQVKPKPPARGMRCSQGSGMKVRALPAEFRPDEPGGCSGQHFGGMQEFGMDRGQIFI